MVQLARLGLRPGIGGTSGGPPGPLASLYTGQVATRSRMNQTVLVSQRQVNSWSLHVARDDITAIQLGFAKFYVPINATSTEPSSGALTEITCSVEYPLGATPQQITWSGGATNGATTYNAVNLSLTDSVTLSTPIPNGAVFAVHVWRASSADSRIPVSSDGATNIAGGISGLGIDQANGAVSGLTDLTLQAGSPGSQNVGATNYFYPQLILGQTRKPSVFIHGTSRPYGRGDTAGSSTPDIGSIARSVGPSFAYHNCGVSGDTLVSCAAQNARRFLLLPYFSHFISDLGTNDDANGRTLAQEQGNWSTILSAAKVVNSSLKVYLTTPEPRTNAANTVPNASDAVRISRAQWIRAGGITNVNGYFEVGNAVADVVPDGSLWGMGSWTGDGIHETLAGYQRIVDYGGIPASGITR